MGYRKIIYDGENLTSLLKRLHEIEERKEKIRIFHIECEEE